MKANSGGDALGQSRWLQSDSQTQSRAGVPGGSPQALCLIKLIQLETRKMQRFRGRSIQRNESKKPLLENNVQDAHKPEGNGSDSLVHQNTLSVLTEQRLQPAQELTLQELAAVLHVQPEDDSTTLADGCGGSEQPEPNSGQQILKQSLIQKYVSQHFPEPPADLDQNLQQHLVNVQNTVLNELTRLSPLLDEQMMGHLIDCYHRQIFNQLHSLLQGIGSSQDSFVLMKWCLKTYLSQELLGHPDLQKIDPIKNIDLLLWTEWGAKAKVKLLDSVQKEVRDSLQNILKDERTQEHCDSEEAYIRLYVDTIQCVDAMPKEAQKISSTLSDHVQEVCFQELLSFVKSYAADQTEVLRKKALMNEPETVQFLRTLKTCKELKQHVQAKGSGTSPPEETVKTLNDTEAFTLKLLMDIVTNTAETQLKNYFRSDNKLFSLSAAVEKLFPKLSYALDEQKRVMDEAYKLIVCIYVKHLIKTNRSKLEKCWSPDVGQTVCEDAEQLHSTISDLAPGVEQWNDILLKIKELLDYKCIQAQKLTAVDIQQDILKMSSDDPELLPALLKWKGLSKGEVREVLHAVHDDTHSRTRSGSWHSCLVCWKG